MRGVDAEALEAREDDLLERFAHDALALGEFEDAQTGELYRIRLGRVARVEKLRPQGVLEHGR